MAEFKVDGLGELMLSLQEIASIPPEVQDEMLNAQADVVVAAQQDSARRHNLEDTGLLIRSIKKTRVKLRKDNVRVIYVYPHGSRKRGKTTTRNAQIAYVHEFGADKTRTIPATQFIREANEGSALETTEAAAAVYDKFLKSKNL